MNATGPHLVTVFTAARQAGLDRAKAVLKAAGIGFSTRNERAPDIGFCGRIVSIQGFAGPPEILVNAEDEAHARELLRELSGRRNDP